MIRNCVQETRVKELEESVQEEKTKPNRTIKEKNEIIRKLKGDSHAGAFAYLFFACSADGISLHVRLI